MSLDTILNLFEPDSGVMTTKGSSDADNVTRAATISAAISLKRIADMLEKDIPGIKVGVERLSFGVEQDLRMIKGRMR